MLTLALTRVTLSESLDFWGSASPAVTWGPGLQPAGSLGNSGPSFLIFVLFTYSHNFIN